MDIGNEVTGDNLMKTALYNVNRQQICPAWCCVHL